MTLSEKILALRKQRGLSQEDLAAMLSITRQAVSRWEQGEGVPDMENIVRLSDIFGVTTDYLLKNGGFTAVKPPEAQDRYEIRDRYAEEHRTEKTPGYRLYKKIFRSGFIYFIAFVVWIILVFLTDQRIFEGSIINGHLTFVGTPFAMGGLGLPFAIAALLHWGLYFRFRDEYEQEEKSEKEKYKKAMEDARPAHRLYAKLFRSGFIYYISTGVFLLLGFLFDTWDTLWVIFVPVGIAHYAMAAWLGIDDEDD